MIEQVHLYNAMCLLIEEKQKKGNEWMNDWMNEWKKKNVCMYVY